MSRTYRIATIPGDGIGKEVLPAALQVLDAAGKRFEFSIVATEFPWGCNYYLETGRMMAEDGLAQMAGFDALFLGAVGDPARVPDHVSLRGLLIAIRQGFDQYVNLRPIRILPGIPGPLRDKGPDDVDILCVRENSEGEYAGLGGRFKRGTPDEVAEQTAVFTRKGTERILRYAFEQARNRPRKRLASATKSNACQHSMVFWDEMTDLVAADYPDVEVKRYHVDALAARMITHPETLDVVVASNLFGDILTDLGGALQGSLGLPASANLDPERRFPSMFEPVHGSAPDIAGKGIANPLAAVWAGSMLLGHLGEREAADAVMAALEYVAAAGDVRTPDLGGRHGTSDVASALISHLGDSPAASSSTPGTSAPAAGTALQAPQHGAQAETATPLRSS
ncbi:MAG: tartrate dehydrogenase [Candidatus Sericytochromatia bacterium]|uniref:D-malate dehydrogenase (decarboxylating) n=1 Tax=Candidatus Tanganyikabacteria bacterium TaxID=2961651 RepID=A0A937X6N5_9BACT|nr:tartrate dehydrogenase [Candidatus Tanganyikabacteria bacterium]